MAARYAERYIQSEFLRSIAKSQLQLPFDDCLKERPSDEEIDDTYLKEQPLNAAEEGVTAYPHPVWISVLELTIRYDNFGFRTRRARNALMRAEQQRAR